MMMIIIMILMIIIIKQAQKVHNDRISTLQS
jgi:hypothetical protein